MKRKPIFDVVRQMLGRSFRESEVAQLDQAISEAVKMSRAVDSPTVPELNVTPGGLSPAGVALIKRFEGCARLRPDGKIEAYPDPGTGGEPWTIGWGSTGEDRFNGGRIKPGTVWTQEQCDRRAIEDYVRYADDVKRALGGALRSTSQQQFDALVSFHYNTGAIGRATLTRKHKAGDYEGAAQEFKRWNKAGGRVMAGLTRRRKAEEVMYRSGM